MAAVGGRRVAQANAGQDLWPVGQVGELLAGLSPQGFEHLRVHASNSMLSRARRNYR